MIKEILTRSYLNIPISNFDKSVDPRNAEIFKNNEDDLHIHVHRPGSPILDRICNSRKNVGTTAI